MPATAVIYCRVSSDRQATEGHGLDGQERRCREYAAAHGYAVAAIFRDEGASGGTIDRPALQEMFTYLRSPGGVDMVLFEDVSRIARDMGVHIQILSRITQLGATYQTVNQPIEDTAVGKFIVQSLANVAELHRNLNAQNVRNRMKARLQAGYWVFENPPGYVYQTVSGHGRLLVPDPASADAVREALEGFASGRFPTQAAVQRFLEGIGVQHHGRKGAIYPEQVRRILTRVLYAGYLECRKWEIGLTKAQHQSLISLDTFYRIQDRLAQKAPVVQDRKDMAADFPLRGFVLCASCRKPLTASWNRGRSRKYPYYRCDQEGCPEHNKAIPRAALEGQFEELLQTIQPDPKVLEVVRRAMLRLWEERTQDFRGLIEKQQRELDGIESAIKKYCEKLLEADSKVVIKAYEDKIEELNTRKLRLGSRIEADTSRLDQFDFGTALGTVLDFVKDPFRMWKSGKLELQRIVLRLVFEEPLVYRREKGFGTASLSLPLAIAAAGASDSRQVVELIRNSWNRLEEIIWQWHAILERI
jgi:DNA invertase Pin-like site-specific DNA recombinase